MRPITNFALCLAVACLASTAILGGEPDRDAAYRRVSGAQQSALEQRQTRAYNALLAATPIVYKQSNTITLNGDGVGDLRPLLLDKHHASFLEIRLQNGTLFYAPGRDFDDRILRLHVDGTYGFQQELKDRADLAAIRLEANPTLAQARTPVDLAMADFLYCYDGLLQPPHKLTSAQIQRARDAYTKRQHCAEELARSLTVKPTSPSEQHDAGKLWNLYLQMRQSAAFLDNRSEFLTPAQIKAIPNPFGNGRPCDGYKTTENTESFNGNEADHRKAASVKFSLKGVEAEKSSGCLEMPVGTLWVYADPLSDKTGTAFMFYWDEKDSWDAKKARVKQTTVEEREVLQKSNSFLEYTIHSTLHDYCTITGKIPEDIQQRANKMIAETASASQTAMEAYRHVVENPSDAAAKLKLVQTMRDSLQIHRRNATLSQRRPHDRELLLNNLPWLFDANQSEILLGVPATAPGTPVSKNANQSEIPLSVTPETGSECQSGPQGKFTLSAKPLNGKQFLSITTEGYMLKDALGLIQSAIQRYYHIPKLTLKLDSGTESKRLKGAVEGASLEEFLKSLATRAGVNLVKDQAAPQTWTLKL